MAKIKPLMTRRQTNKARNLLAMVVKEAGGNNKLAAKLKCTPQQIGNWLQTGVIPFYYVRLTKLSPGIVCVAFELSVPKNKRGNREFDWEWMVREDFRPDIWG